MHCNYLFDMIFSKHPFTNPTKMIKLIKLIQIFIFLKNGCIIGSNMYKSTY